MTAAPIPSYPVIHVDVGADGSAHVNVAGRHIDYPAAALPDTRAAVTRYAVGMALELGRPVRIHTTDPAGVFRMAAHPDGTVTDLASADGKPERRRRPQPGPAPTAAPTVVIPRPTRPAPAAAAAARMPHAAAEVAPAAPQHALATAVLTFSSGDTVAVTGSALIGRRPTPLEDEPVDDLVTIDDTTRTMSKTHFRVEWHKDRLWISDRGAANGVILRRDGETAATLTAWQPCELQHGDVLLIGDVTVTVTTDDPTQTETRS